MCVYIYIYIHLYIIIHAHTCGPPVPKVLGQLRVVLLLVVRRHDPARGNTNCQSMAQTNKGDYIDNTQEQHNKGQTQETDRSIKTEQSRGEHSTIPHGAGVSRRQPTQRLIGHSDTASFLEFKSKIIVCKLSEMQILSLWVDPGGAKHATSVQMPLLRLRSSEGKCAVSREIEPVRRSFRRRGSCTFGAFWSIALAVRVTKQA